MTRYAYDKATGEVVEVKPEKAAPGIRIRKDAYRGLDGRGAVVTQIKRGHPAIAEAQVPTNAKGRPVITSAAERDRLCDAYNRHEEGRSGQKLVWTREAEDDE